MVLKTLVLVLLCGGLWGCSQSLFDSHGGDDVGSGSGSGSGSNVLPSTCAAPCLGDAGSNFDGTPWESRRGLLRFYAKHYGAVQYLPLRLLIATASYPFAWWQSRRRVQK